MSSPYGPPPGGQQGSGQPAGGYGAPSWPSGQGAPAYGGPGPTAGYGSPTAGPGSSQPAGGPPPGYGQPFGGPGQGTPPGQAGPGPSGHGAPGQWGGPAPKAKNPVDLSRILPVAIGVLGILAFIFGFLPGLKYASGDTSLDVTQSVYAVQGFLPILLLLVGLLALAPLIPGGRSYSLPAALLSVAGLLGTLATVFTVASGTGAAKGFGLWLILVVSVVQTAATAYAWFTEAGPGRPARSAGDRGTGHAARSFGPSQGPGPSGPAQPAPAPSAPAPLSSGYAPQGYGQADAPSYGGYAPSSYAPAGGGVPPSGPTTEGSGHYGQPSDAVPHTGSNPAVDGGSPYSPYGAAPTGPSATAQGSTGSGAGQHGRDDGPPPDVTQQVRF